MPAWAFANRLVAICNGTPGAALTGEGCGFTARSTCRVADTTVIGSLSGVVSLGVV